MDSFLACRWLGTPNLSVRVTASDPAGQDNLGNCIGESGASKTYVVDLTVSNETGGVTTASVSVVAD